MKKVKALHQPVKDLKESTLLMDVDVLVKDAAGDDALADAEETATMDGIEKAETRWNKEREVQLRHDRERQSHFMELGAVAEKYHHLCEYIKVHITVIENMVMIINMAINTIMITHFGVFAIPQQCGSERMP